VLSEANKAVKRGFGTAVAAESTKMNYELRNLEGRRK
jgi:hypothetical protein